MWIRPASPENNNDFRVFKGPKGAVKEQQMVNVVTEGVGSIFITKNGQLRLILDKHETSWIQGSAKPTALTPLDLDTLHQRDPHLHGSGRVRRAAAGHAFMMISNVRAGSEGLHGPPR